MAGPVAFLVPDPIQSTQLIPGSNTPASGALLFVYEVGTSTKTNSYTDPSASTARTNPIVLDSGGSIPGNGEVWITSTAKFVLAPSNDTDPPSSPYWTRDNYYGINNITATQVQALSAQSEWVQGSTATFVGATLFSLVGDQTLLYTLGRRVKAAVTGGDRFAIVTSSVLSGGSTSVGITLDSGTLNGGLSSVQYGILSTPNGSVPWTQITSTGVILEGPLSVLGTLSVSGAVFGANFSPTVTSLPAIGFYLVSTTNAALSVNSTKIIDWTSTKVSISVTSFAIGPVPSSSGTINLPPDSFINCRAHSSSSDVSFIGTVTRNSFPDVVLVGGATSSANASVGVILKSRSAPITNPTPADILDGEWGVFKNPAASTYAIYVNNKGTIQSSAVFT